MDPEEFSLRIPTALREQLNGETITIFKGLLEQAFEDGRNYHKEEVLREAWTGFSHQDFPRRR